MRLNVTAAGSAPERFEDSAPASAAVVVGKGEGVGREEGAIAAVEGGDFSWPALDGDEEELEDILGFDEVSGGAAAGAPPRRLLQHPPCLLLDAADEEEKHPPRIRLRSIDRSEFGSAR